MATITFKGNPIQTSGNLPAKGAKAPDFKLTRTDLSDVSLKDFSGKKKILNIARAWTRACAQHRPGNSTKRCPRWATRSC